MLRLGPETNASFSARDGDRGQRYVANICLSTTNLVIKYAFMYLEGELIFAGSGKKTVHFERIELCPLSCFKLQN